VKAHQKVRVQNSTKYRGKQPKTSDQIADNKSAVLNEAAQVCGRPPQKSRTAGLSAHARDGGSESGVSGVDEKIPDAFDATFG
jgi:hypothetical protein